MIAKSKSAAGSKRTKAKPARRVSLPLKGGCHCGALRYRVNAAPKDSGYCHCTDCQKTTGGPTAAWFAVGTGSFSYVKGVPVGLQILGLGAAGVLRHLRLPDPVPAAEAGADGERQCADPGQAGGGAAAAAYLRQQPHRLVRHEG